MNYVYSEQVHRLCMSKWKNFIVTKYSICTIFIKAYNIHEILVYKMHGYCHVLCMSELTYIH